MTKEHIPHYRGRLMDCLDVVPMDASTTGSASSRSRW